MYAILKSRLVIVMLPSYSRTAPIESTVSDICHCIITINIIFGVT